MRRMKADDVRRLPEEHRKLFVQAVHDVLRPALED
jgi:hypothetical protein